MYSNDVVTVRKRANWNTSATCKITQDCFTDQMVSDVLGTYKSMASSGEVVEYQEPKSLFTETIAKKVSERSKIYKDKVMRILEETYYATWDGSLQNKNMLYPKTSGAKVPEKKKEEAQNRPKPKETTDTTLPAAPAVFPPLERNPIREYGPYVGVGLGVIGLALYFKKGSKRGRK